MNLIDCHTHSTNSPDGYGAPEAMVLEAVSKGICAYALTDHCEINRWFRREHYRDGELSCNPRDTYDFAHSFETAMEDNIRLKEKYSGKIELISGIELGQAQFDFGLAAAVSSDARLDFTIASLHQIKGYDDFAFTDYNENDPGAMVRQYYREMLEVCRKGSFDILGHLTYPLRYIEGNNNIKINMTKNDEIICEIFRTLIERGKGIEINTSGLRQKYGKTFPDMKYLKMYRQMGGDIISLGSDAHRCEDIGAGIKEGIELAAEAGFKYLSIFKNHKVQAISICNQ